MSSRKNKTPWLSDKAKGAGNPANGAGLEGTGRGAVLVVEVGALIHRLARRNGEVRNAVADQIVGGPVILHQHGGMGTGRHGDVDVGLGVVDAREIHEPVDAVDDDMADLVGRRPRVAAAVVVDGNGDSQLGVGHRRDVILALVEPRRLVERHAARLGRLERRVVHQGPGRRGDGSRHVRRGRGHGDLGSGGKIPAAADGTEGQDAHDPDGGTGANTLPDLRDETVSHALSFSVCEELLNGAA